MSIRTYNKDHLSEHAKVRSVAPNEVVAPESGDPLVFWTKHEKEPCEVDLRIFLTGTVAIKKASKKKFTPFTGRPNLIKQLAPAIQEYLYYAGKGTVEGYFSSLRSWWRILDSVESTADQIGISATRVDDVMLITSVHAEFAHRSGMLRQTFGKFRILVDTTRMALGERPTYWESPEDMDVIKHIPPKEQRDAVRFALRAKCRSVLERWELSNRLSQSDAAPSDPQEFKMWRDVKYMLSIQEKTGKTLPNVDDIQDDIPLWAINTRGRLCLRIRESIYPNHTQADAVWHQCLVNTGWNPSTLTSLDVSKRFLFDHIKNDPTDSHKRFVLSPLTYELVGEKARAGGKEQFVTGQWKTLDGPGHLIKTYLARVEPLREILKIQLDNAKREYELNTEADYQIRAKKFALIKSLQQGIRSVWLYINRHGNVSWIGGPSHKSEIVEGKNASFLYKVVFSLNSKRTKANSCLASDKVHQDTHIPSITPKDFRVWFADYVYRASHGSILHVKKALNHSRLRTSIGYTNTSTLNAEANDSARRFLNILVGELEVGRVDLTILAHLYRYGQITPEQEELLTQARKLPKSRMKVACKDSRNPPPLIKASPHQDCDVQRCLLCQENAVLLPESLDGIAMRIEELLALQGFIPIETWIEDLYDIELKNNHLALRKFDLNNGLAARKKWALAISTGEHYVPGLPLDSSFDQL